METLRYIDFNRNSQFRLWRQQSDGRRIQENATLWEWIYHAFEILNMTTIRTHWNHGFIGMIRLHVTCILNEGNYAKLKRLPFNQRNARTEKTKIEKIGCEIAYNRFLLHYSRKTQEPKTTETVIWKLFFSRFWHLVAFNKYIVIIESWIYQQKRH